MITVSVMKVLNITKQRKKIKLGLFVTFFVIRIDDFYWSFLGVQKLLNLLSHGDFKQLSEDKLLPTV